MNSADLNWTELGKALRQSADDAHELHGKAPLDVRFVYPFLIDNPECFLRDGQEEWPEFMPVEPPIELITAYYGAI